MMHRKNNKGFTLVELIISVGLFTVVITIAMTAYLRLISINRTTRATNDLVTNLSFAVDSMSRAIRTGKDYSCNNLANCEYPAGGDRVSFLNELGQQVTYIRMVSGNLAVVGECVGISSIACNATAAATTTDPRIYIDTLRFYVKGFDNDQTQPQVFFTLKGSLRPDAKTASTTFTIESGATQRYLDIFP